MAKIDPALFNQQYTIDPYNSRYTRDTYGMDRLNHDMLHHTTFTTNKFFYELSRRMGAPIDVYERITPRDVQVDCYTDPQTLNGVVGSAKVDMSIVANPRHYDSWISQWMQTKEIADKAEKERMLRETNPELMEAYKIYEATLLMMGEK